MEKLTCHMLWWRGAASDKVYSENVQDDHKAPWRPWVSEVDSAAAGEGCRNVSLLQGQRVAPGFDRVEATLSSFSRFFLKMYLFIICKYTVAVFRHTRRGHPISFLMVVSCWELNSGPLEEQSVLLTAEPFLQLPHFHIKEYFGAMKINELYEHVQL